MDDILLKQMKKHPATKRRGIKGVFGQTIVWILLIIVITLLVLPLIITFLYSLKLPAEHLMDIWTLPSNPQWAYYGEAISRMGLNVINTLIVCIVTTVGVVLFSSITAYVFSRHDFLGKEVMFSLVIALMMVPAVLTMTPSFLVIERLGLLDTRWALILPGIAGGQVGAIFLFRTFFSQQPDAIFESATLDGANDIIMYATITLPLAVPVLIIQALGTFSLMYNDFLWPMLVVKDEAVQTLMPRLKYIAEEVSMQKPGVAYAMYILAGIPLTLISLFGLKYFVSGDFASGMKL